MLASANADRIEAILKSREARGAEAIAAHLAYSTKLTVDQAIGYLKAVHNDRQDKADALWAEVAAKQNAGHAAWH